VNTNHSRPSSYLTRCLASPFAAYATGFLFAMAVYSLGYSDLYPPLEPLLVSFLLVTCVICGFLACVVGTITDTCQYGYESLQFHTTVFLVLVGLLAAECIYSGGVPLLSAAAGDDSEYLAFGIPTVNVAFIGFSLFYAVYWFDLYLLRYGRIFLAFSLLAASTSIIIVHRGGFIIDFVAAVFVYLQRRGLERKLIITFTVLVSAMLWGFGLLGDLRTHNVSGESVILGIGRASDKFLNSNIPTELFWPYLYISSPLSNLQLNITDRVATDKPSLYMALELLPDFVSKRLVPEDAVPGTQPILVTEQLNVSTMYARPFLLMGWLGIFLSFMYFVIIVVVCLNALRGSKYFIATSSILSSLGFLNIFTNMYLFAGGITLVLAALVLHLFERPSLNKRTN
jgi:oligosaccharide repeat unit polymerase